MKRRVFLILLCLALIVTGCSRGPMEVAEVGKPAPDFTLQDLNGTTWTLSELKGQVVFINFWATWCPPCREEMPSMQNLYSFMPKEKFKMLAILNNDDPALAKSFAATFGLTMPILDDQANIVGPRYGLTGVPETFIIDKQGILREKVIGPAPWDNPNVTRMLKHYMNQ